MPLASTQRPFAIGLAICAIGTALCGNVYVAVRTVQSLSHVASETVIMPAALILECTFAQIFTAVFTLTLCGFSIFVARRSPIIWALVLSAVVLGFMTGQTWSWALNWSAVRYGLVFHD